MELVQGAPAFQTLALQERAALFARGTEGSNSAPSGRESVSHVEEWSPTDEQIAARPALDDERHRPRFLLVAARRYPRPADTLAM